MAGLDADSAEALALAASRAAAFREALNAGPQRPVLDYAGMLRRFDAPTPATGLPAVQVIDELTSLAAPGR